MNLKWLLSSHAPAATLLIRILVGAVFLSEGVQKFLFPTELGVGRFVRIGIPAPTRIRNKQPSHIQKSVRASWAMLQKPYRGSLGRVKSQNP